MDICWLPARSEGFAWSLSARLRSYRVRERGCEREDIERDGENDRENEKEKKKDK